MALDTRGMKFSSLDVDEVPMQQMFMDNLIPEERKSIFLVVCISDKPVTGAPTREGSWTRIDLAQNAEATDRATVFHRRQRCPGSATWSSHADKGFLCVTFDLPEAWAERGDADTLPRVHVYATATPGTMDVVLREGVCADHPNDAWIVLGGTQATKGRPTPCKLSHCFPR